MKAIVRRRGRLARPDDSWHAVALAAADSFGRAQPMHTSGRRVSVRLPKFRESTCDRILNRGLAPALLCVVRVPLCRHPAEGERLAYLPGCGVIDVVGQEALDREGGDRGFGLAGVGRKGGGELCF